MIALLSPALALPIVGAPGALPVMVMVCVACAAALTLALPLWSAPIVHWPARSIVTVVPPIEQTLAVSEL